MAPVWKAGRALRLGTAWLDLGLVLDAGVEEDFERRKFESVDEDDADEIVEEGGLREAAAPWRPGGARDLGW